MVRFTVLWKNPPTDVAGFDRHYRDVHIPLARKMVGIRRYTLGRNLTPVRGGESYFQIGELDFDDMASLERAFQSPEGRATADDVAHIVEVFGARVHSVIYELEDV